MKVLYHFRTRGTGAEGVHIAGIAGALRRLGHEVSFQSPTGVDPTQSKGKSPFGAGKPSLVQRIVGACPGVLFEFLELAYNLSVIRRLGGRLKGEAFDLIYERHAFFLCATSWLARRRGIPLVVEVNELVGDARVRAQPLLSGLARRCDRFVFERARLIIVVSPHLKRRIEAQGIPSERVLVLPNAIERAEYEMAASGAHVRDRVGLPEEACVIGFVGWFVAWHRLDRLIRVFAEVHRQFPRTHLMLVGDGELREELVALAKASGVGEFVHFPGTASHPEIPQWIAAMDIGVVPHSNEFRSPIKIFEYMGQGKAVLAPRTEPIEMVVKDGVNGRLFDTEADADLKTKLLELVAQPEKRSQLGAQARCDVLEKHTWEANAKAVLQGVE